jgi:cytoskeletal protein CcmA (bactofilin family)
MNNEKPNCPNCGRPLSFSNARFCTSCGASLPGDGTDGKEPDAERKSAPKPHLDSRTTKTGMEKLDLGPFLSPVIETSETSDADVPATDIWKVEAPAKDAAKTPVAAEAPSSPTAETSAGSPSPAGEANPTDQGDAPSVTSVQTSPTSSSSEQSSPPVDSNQKAKASAPVRGKDDQMANIKPPTQEKRTIVEEGTKIKGDLESACPVVVHGRVEGAVQAPSLTVSKSGVVEGTAQVGTIECEGELAGEFDADRIELSGTVKDSTIIRAETIEMKLTSKGGKKQLVFGDVQDADQPANLKTQSTSTPNEPPAPKPSEPPPSKRRVNGRPSEAPPPAE